MLGSVTALFGGLVMLTQPSVKTALAWSTIAQMGFLMQQCGLGLWPLALLHIVAHSLYKAHAFLSSGGAIQSVLSTRKPGHVAVPGLASFGKAFVLGLILYAAIATCFSIVFGPKSAQALALGAILVFRVSYLIAQGLADTAPGALAALEQSVRAGIDLLPPDAPVQLSLAMRGSDGTRRLPRSVRILGRGRKSPIHHGDSQ